MMEGFEMLLDFSDCFKETVEETIVRWNEML
jgi:hypothetical protein